MVALVVMASASFGSVSAKKKDKKVKAEPKPALVLSSSSDTLSYVAGKSLTNGLLPYLQQQYGVDSVTISDFIRGFEEMRKGADDPRMKAYAAGLDIAQRVEKMMMPRMKNDFDQTPDSIIDALVYRGFVDALCNDTSVYKQEEAEKLFREMGEANKKAKDERLYGANREAGVRFLAENAKKDSVVVLPSGLQYKVLVKGEGLVPEKSDKVQVNYEGRLIDGTVFDSSSKHGSKPSEFMPTQVIKGWTEALTMMPVGSKWELYIPQELAYGERNAGNIKPFSALIFTVELVGIVGKTDAPAPAQEVTPAAKLTPAKKVAKKK